MALNSFILRVRSSPPPPLGIFRSGIRSQFLPVLFSRFSTGSASSTDEDIIRTLETQISTNIIDEDDQENEQSSGKEESSMSDDDDKTTPDVLSVESLFRMTPNQEDSFIPEANTKGCTIPDILRSIPDEFAVRKISLKREYQDELISMDVVDDDNSINDRLLLDVFTMKGIKDGLHEDLKFDLTASSNKLALNNITARRKSHISGIPEHCQQLDAFVNFLAIRGIIPTVTNFLLDHINSKKQDSRCSTASSSTSE